MSTILVVDDEAGIRELLQEILHDEGHQVRLAENAENARLAYGRETPDLVLLDIWMPDTDGITLLKEWAAAGQLCMPVVMMSGHGTIDTAVEATKIGAYDFLEKPIALQKLLHTVGRALKRGESMVKPRPGLAVLGKSRAITDLQARLQQMAGSRGSVLLIGEAGSPFETAARLLHNNETPWTAPEDTSWLGENPADILEQTRGGVLFLREIAQLSKIEQRGLALVLSRLDRNEVRLVCGSTQALPQLVAERLFDADLFQALSRVTVSLPSLREHRDDIPDIAKAQLQTLIENKEASPKVFSTAALNALRVYDWPGNLGELQNVIRTLAMTVLGEEIGAEDVRRVLSQFEGLVAANLGNAIPLDLPLRDARDIFERQYFEHHIQKAAGNMSRVADAVGLERTHLYRKLKQLEIKLARKPE